MSASITRFRGDTAPDQFVVKRDNVVVNITGCTFKLTVNTQKDPVNDDDELFSLTGSITSATVGEVEFAPNLTQANQTPGAYHYDVQMTDASSAIRTVAKGTYRFIQDITKS